MEPIEIGLIVAMKAERDPLIVLMEDPEDREIGGMRFTVGRLCGRRTVLALSGVGKVFAAMCAQTMILHFAPQYILNTGVAGALHEELAICDTVIGDSMVQHDMDTSAVGDPVGMISGINRIELPCDPALRSCLISAAETLKKPYRRGIIATGDQFVADRDRRRAVRETFGAIACEMEGAAVAQVCFVNGVPFGASRSISDTVSGNASMEYASFVHRAAGDSVELLKQVFLIL